VVGYYRGLFVICYLNYVMGRGLDSLTGLCRAGGGTQHNHGKETSARREDSVDGIG